MHDLTTAFWRLAFAWIGISLPRDLATLFSFLAFSTACAFGARRDTHGSNGRRAAFITSGTFLGILFLVVSASTLFFTQGMRNEALAFAAIAPAVVLGTHSDKPAVMTGYLMLFAVFYSILFLTKIPVDAYSGLVEAAIQYIRQFVPFDTHHWHYAWKRAGEGFIFLVLISLFYVFPLTMLEIAPIAALTKRFSFLMTGLIFCRPKSTIASCPCNKGAAEATR